MYNYYLLIANCNIKDFFSSFFEGWFTEEALTNEFTAETQVTENITVYAKWEAIPAATYTVTFDSNEGTAVDAITEVAKDATVELPVAPTKEGFTFEGWFTEAEFTNEFTAATQVTDNITVYAKWEAIPAATYTVTFDSNEGTAVDAITDVEKDATVTLPVAPTKDGYTFEGWFTEEALTNEFTAETQVTENIIVYAKWGLDIISKGILDGFSDGKGIEFIGSRGVDEGLAGKNPYQLMRIQYTRKVIEAESITLEIIDKESPETVYFTNKGGKALTVDSGTTGIFEWSYRDLSNLELTSGEEGYDEAKSLIEQNNDAKLETGKLVIIRITAKLGELTQVIEEEYTISEDDFNNSNI